MNRPSIRNILVPIDFSKMSIDVIKTAERLARRFAATIHLAHVRQFGYAGFAPPAAPLVPFSLMGFEQDRDKNILQQLNVLAHKNTISSATCHVLGGGPAFDEICRLAQRIPADLIVMPTHGRTGLKHVFLGSTAERIVRHAPCPVLVTRGSAHQSQSGSRLGIRRILVPIDFSSRSREGLQYAIGLANEVGAKITLLHATYLGYVYSAEGTALYDIRGLQKAARENAERKMRKFVRASKFGCVKYETAFTDGSPALDVCDFAKSHNIDLIVTSTHGLTGYKHVLIGSIAEQVVRHASCPVLVVPSHPQPRMTMLKKTRAKSTSRKTHHRTQSVNSSVRYHVLSATD